MPEEELTANEGAFLFGILVMGGICVYTAGEVVVVVKECASGEGVARPRSLLIPLTMLPLE